MIKIMSLMIRMIYENDKCDIINLKLLLMIE